MSCCESKTKTLASVKEYYGEILNTTKDLKTTACTTSSAPPLIIRKAIAKIPDEVLEKYYGCGSPLPTGLKGLTVLDLGSGSGRDCYIASSMVGSNGKVIGIDMTDNQLNVARKHVDDYCINILGYEKSNMVFKKGYIEDISTCVDNESIDLVISNCVVNLSPDKHAVINGVFNALKYGGELYFSDVYCDRRLPEIVKKHEVLWGECISGALYVEDFRRICNSVGFLDVRELTRSPIEVTDPELKEVVGNAKFWSITYRCFKLKDMETLCEDYGQVAVYLGTIPGHTHCYKLDNGHLFETNKPMLVCGNSASMVGDSWLKPHFKITGDRSVHYGLFADCYKAIEPNTVSEPQVAGGCC